MRRTKAYRLIFVGVASVLLGGCSGSSKANMEEAAEQPAVVDYTCISNPESDKQIYVILKNYHGAYWEKVIDGITEAAKKLDEAVYLGGIDNETDISGQIDLMNQAMEQGADGILLAPADSNSLADSCQKVREKDIPVVLIDSSINSSEFDACYMTDNIDAGEMAALGGEVNLNTVDGEVLYEVKPGTQTDTRIRLKGKGVPSLRNKNVRGDHYVTLVVQVPTNLIEDAKEALRKFDEACGNRPAGSAGDSTEKSEKKKKSFMDKLKETFEE